MMCEIDVTLIELAFIYLSQVKKMKRITAGDLLWTAKKIRDWSRRGNRFKKANKLDFSSGHLRFDDSLIS
jgi:hypothetical protein